MMKKLIFSICILCVFLSGCAKQASTQPAPMLASQVDAPAPMVQAFPTPTQAAASNPTVETPTSVPEPENSGGACNNPYYPVVDGASWIYDMEDQPQVVHTMSVEEEDKFKIAIVDVDSAAVLEGECTPEGIIILNRGMEGSFFSESGSSSTTSTSRAGVTLPNDLKVGSTWTETVDIVADGGDDGDTLNASIIVNYNAVGVETVTVPAGTFEALRIEQNGSMNMMGQEILTQGTLWYARGVGNVKAETGMANGERFLIQLISYDIP
jgi:hypothetical protein